MKKIVAIIIIFVALVVIIGAMLFYKRKSMSRRSMTERNMTERKMPYKVPRKDTDTVCAVTFIGDSWAEYGNRYDVSGMITRGLSEKGIRARVICSGLPGATSKDIYESLFSDSYGSLKPYIMSRPDYVVLSCGINDMNCQYEPDFYTHHTMLIIDLLIENGMRPILIKLPHWNIYKNYKYSTARRFFYGLSYFIETGNIDFAKVVDIYREKLDEAVVAEGIAEEIFILDSDKLDKKDLWADCMHINAEGYKLLTDEICSRVSKHYLFMK